MIVSTRNDETFDSEPIFEADKDLSFTIGASRLVDFDGMLDPGETIMFMGTYYVTQDDINAGKIVNVGSTKGSTPIGKVVTDTDEYEWKITTPGSADLNGNGKVDFADSLDPCLAGSESQAIIPRATLTTMGKSPSATS